jgi:hypothetical protein
VPGSTLPGTVRYFHDGTALYEAREQTRGPFRTLVNVVSGVALAMSGTEIARKLTEVHCAPDDEVAAWLEQRSGLSRAA